MRSLSKDRRRVVGVAGGPSRVGTAGRENRPPGRPGSATLAGGHLPGRGRSFSEATTPVNRSSLSTEFRGQCVCGAVGGIEQDPTDTFRQWCGAEHVEHVARCLRHCGNQRRLTTKTRIRIPLSAFSLCRTKRTFPKYDLTGFAPPGGDTLSGLRNLSPWRFETTVTTGWATAPQGRTSGRPWSHAEKDRNYLARELTRTPPRAPWARRVAGRRAFTSILV